MALDVLRSTYLSCRLPPDVNRFQGGRLRSPPVGGYLFSSEPCTPVVARKICRFGPNSQRSSKSIKKWITTYVSAGFLMPQVYTPPNSKSLVNKNSCINQDWIEGLCSPPPEWDFKIQQRGLDGTSMAHLKSTQVGTKVEHLY